MILNRDLRFAASVTLTLGLALDPAADTASITYQLHIIPILFTFQAEDSFAFSLDAVHEGRFSAYVEKKIIEAVENYQKLQEEPGYQKDSMVVDPVCGITINRLDAAATADHQGETYYFCVPACRDRFLENPQRFILD
ncbi:MAG: YHS domain-containing protein [Planctomycetes bacterium]|nr:YHS domain-containing protein [Planctomycetota bacterium]